MADGAGQVTTRLAEGAASRRWVVLAVVSCAQFMVLLDATVVNVALPRLTEDLKFSDTTRPWILDAYTLAFGGLLLLGSRAADVVGRRTVFLTGLALFTMASVGCGAATDPAQFIVARAAQGVGAAMLSPAAFSLVTVSFPAGRERNIAFGIWGGLGGLGATVGVLLGGVVVHALGWPWAFFVNMPLGLVAGVAAVVLLRTERSPARGNLLGRLDVGGAVTVTAALLALVYAIVMVHGEGWASPVVLMSVAVAALLFAGFAVIERRVSAPLLSRRLVRNRHLLVGCLSDFLVGAIQLSVLFAISLQAQVAMHLDPLRTGLSFLPMGMIAIAAAIMASWSVHRVGARVVYLAGMALGSAGLSLFAVLHESSSYLWALLVPSLLVGVCLPTGSVVATIVGTTGADRTEAGVVSGTLTASFQIGSALGLAVTATAATAGLRAAYLAIIAFAVLGLLNAAAGFRLLSNTTGSCGPATSRRPPGA